MTKSYDPPLTTNPHGPLYRVDKAIKAAQQRLDAAIDAKRHHTSQNLAHEVIKEAREGLKKSEQLRVLRIRELARKAAETEAAGKQERRLAKPAGEAETSATIGARSR